MSNFKIKDLPEDDRPREKLLKKGAEALTDAELLAILLRTGTRGTSVVDVARKLLNENHNLAVLATRSAAVLLKTHGIGKDKAATLMAAFEISKRIILQSKWREEKQITSPEHIADIFIPRFRDELKEKFTVVCLNSANKIITFETISVGSLDSSIVHPREVYKVAVENSSKSIILLHNHPSGNPEPSNEDIRITKRLIEAGKVFDINVFDHIIIAGSSYTSFAERGLL